MNITATAATVEPDAGWGRLVALVLTGLAFWAFTIGHRRWKELRTATKNHSPARSTVTVNAVKPQVTATVDSETGHPGQSAAVAVRTATAVAVKESPLDEFVALQLGHMNTTQIVREAKRAFNVSDATAWRAVRKAKVSAP